MKLFILVAVAICAVAQCQAGGSETVTVSPFSITFTGNRDASDPNNKIVIQLPTILKHLLNGLQRFKDYCDEKGWTKLSEFASYWIDLLNQRLKDQTSNDEDAETPSEAPSYKKQRWASRYRG